MRHLIVSDISYDPNTGIACGAYFIVQPNGKKFYGEYFFPCEGTSLAELRCHVTAIKKAIELEDGFINRLTLYSDINKSITIPPRMFDLHEIFDNSISEFKRARKKLIYLLLEYCNSFKVKAPRTSGSSKVRQLYYECDRNAGNSLRKMLGGN